MPLDAPRLLTEFSALHADLDQALTKFGADDEEGKKKEGGGSGVKTAAAVAAGAGAVAGGAQVHRGVMRHAQESDAAPGVANAYKAAGQRVQDEAGDISKRLKRAWKYPRQKGQFMANPGTSDRARTVAKKATSEGGRVIRKIVKTVTHFGTPLDTVTALCAEADQALTQFAHGDEEEDARKKRGPGGALLAGATVGAGGALAHRKVMSTARNQGPLPGGLPGVGQAYKQAGAQVADRATGIADQARQAGEQVVDTAKGLAGKAKSLWKNFRGKAAGPVLKIAGFGADPNRTAVTELNRQADEALVKFGREIRRRR